MKNKKILFVLLLIIAVASLYMLFARGSRVGGDIIVYGNVDQRQVALAFTDPERIAELLVEEGEVVQLGQVLARQDTRRLLERIAEGEAMAEAAAAALLRLKNGTRPEEVDQARSTVEASEAEALYAQGRYKRFKDAWERSKGVAVSRQDVDEALSSNNVAQARLVRDRKALTLALLGPRQEDIAEAAANLSARQQQLAVLRRQLDDAMLKSPAQAVVRSRLMEAGEMASAQRPVFSLALLSPKWVRGYVSETELGRLRPGMGAKIYTDSHPGALLTGTLGFISPTAEFTPKTVQTPDLRTSLVYEIRVYVDDSSDRLRLGMPATLVIVPAAEQSAAGK